MEILEKDTKPEFEKKEEKSAPEEQKPALTNEQYAQMAEINARVRDLKQFGFDIREHIDGMNKEVARLDGELEKARTELIGKTQEMQECFDSFILKPYGITGQIAIADTEPHYITVVEPTQAPQD